MPSLLAIETATDVCSVAVVEDEEVVVEYTLDRPRKHSEQLVLMVQEALRTSELSLADLDAVAVSKGPGSYTGLRIGVSSAKGLAMASNCDLVGVPTLEALAASLSPFASDGDHVCALLDARRDEVYAALYEAVAGRLPGEVMAAQACTVGELPALVEKRATKRCWLVGDGVEKAANDMLKSCRVSVVPLSAEHPAPSARWIGRIAHRDYASGVREDLATFEPYYLKEFETGRSKGSIFDRLPS